MGEQVANGHGQVVVRIHQPGRTRDNAVPIGIGVVAEGDVEIGP
jgi:hypothetical protein